MSTDKTCAARRSVEDDDEIWTGVEVWGGKGMEEARFDGTQVASGSGSLERSTHLPD